jgi:hypothetical protein
MLVIRCRPRVTPCQHSPPQHKPTHPLTSTRLQGCSCGCCVYPCSSARLCDVTPLDGAAVRLHAVPRLVGTLDPVVIIYLACLPFTTPSICGCSAMMSAEYESPCLDARRSSCRSLETDAATTALHLQGGCGVVT